MESNFMIIKFLYIIGLFFLGLSFLIPIDGTTWETFFSEYLVFLALFFLVFSFFCNEKKILPKLILPFFIISFIPICQFFFGQIYFWTTAVISFFYLISFFVAVIFGYNCELSSKFKLMTCMCIVLTISAVVSSIIAISQWLNINISYFPNLSLIGSRAYANFGQPNHLSTFLFIGSIATWYLYEKNKIESYYAIIIIFLLMFGIVLTQSRTAWVTSFAILILYFYLKKTSSFKIKARNLILFFGFYFLLVFSLNSINYFVDQVLNFNVIKTDNITNRITSGYERLEIWKQSWYLILEQPWFGYGWNQVSVSIVEKIDYFYLNSWYSSSHNIILDLFLWVGLPLGLTIILFFVLLIYKLIINSHTKESNLALLILVPIVIHANLEYPLFYSYFILPLGMFIGISLVDIKAIKYFNLNKCYVYLYSFFFCIFLILTWTEYLKLLEDKSKAKTIALNRIEGKHSNFYRINSNYYLLTSLKIQVDWIALDSREKYTKIDLEKYENFVKCNPSKYNLFKIAQIYFYNNDLEKAQKYLKIFNKLFDVNFTLADLVKVRN